jgi:hypothetical protein
VAGLQSFMPPNTLGAGTENYTIDYVEDRVSNLQSRIAAEIGSPPRPDAIFTIASSATMAANKARGPGATTPPIIPAVISDPAGDPATQGANIKGVSTSLASIVIKCRDFLKQIATGNSIQFEAHCHTFGSHHAAGLARNSLDGHPDAALHHNHHSHPDAYTTDQILQDIGSLPTLHPGNRRRNGILVIPDDRVVARWRDVVRAAQAPRPNNSPGVPVFFQQLECVWNTSDPLQSALGAYGLSADTIGRAAAFYVAAAFQGQPLPQWVAPSNFELWVNTSVAGALGLSIPPSVLAQASRVFSP